MIRKSAEKMKEICSRQRKENSRLMAQLSSILSFHFLNYLEIEPKIFFLEIIRMIRINLKLLGAKKYMLHIIHIEELKRDNEEHRTNIIGKKIKNTITCFIICVTLILYNTVRQVVQNIIIMAFGMAMMKCMRYKSADL